MLTVRAVHTFEAEHGDELEFQAGEPIIVLEKDDAFGDGWWRGRNIKGDEGLFPATYITESPPSPGPDQEPLPKSESGPPSPRAMVQRTPSDPPSPTTAPVGNARLAPPPFVPVEISPKSAASDQFVAAPIPARDVSPGSTTGRFFDDAVSPRTGTSDTFIESAVATVSSAATGVTNVMGRTIGEIQDAIESIAQPATEDVTQSEDEQELGIGSNARARLAAQAQMANEQREKNPRMSGGVTGLVYSDESEDEEDPPHVAPVMVHREERQVTPPLDSSLTSSPARVHTPQPALGLPERGLSPPLPLPSTPPLDRVRSDNAPSRAIGVPPTPPITWTVDDVVEWAKTKGFDEGICERFRDHEISGDMLLELDANLLKELDIPQFGKRHRIAQAIADLRRPPSTVSSSSQHLSPAVATVSSRGVSGPPSAVSQPSNTPPLVTTPDTASPTAWAPSVAPSTTDSTYKDQTPAAINPPPATASMPVSPVTPNSSGTKRESTGSMGHKKGRPSIEKLERLSFFGRTRKPAPSAASPGPERTSSLKGLPPNRTHQMQPASLAEIRSTSGNAAPGAAKALQQIGTPDHSGYLKKKGDRYGSWKTRFFVLKGSHLYYMQSETEDRVKGHIDVRGHRLVVDENTNPGSYGFRLAGPDKPYSFSSPEQSVIREWMKALMKATIARDYKVPVTSSCNIPTIPLAEAQALAPRPPSPATRDATQRAMRRENTNTLTAHDASVLMSLDTSSGQRRRESQTINLPLRPSRDTRRPSANLPRPSVASFYQADEATYSDLVRWVNSALPPTSPRASSLPQSFISGELVFLLVRSLSGIVPSPPIPPNAFAPENGMPGLPGLFSMMDMLIDAGIDTAGVSINDVRLGDAAAIARLLESVKGWNDRRTGLVQ